MNSDEVGRQLRRPEGENGLKVAESMNQSNLEMYNLVFSNLSLQEGQHLLEIGFGNGKFFDRYFALNPGIKVTGIDFSELMCREAAANNQEFISRNKLSIINGDASDTPFADNTFDRIVTLNTLYFWSNPLKQLTEIKRILKPDGLFSVAYRPRECVENLPFTKEVFTLYHPHEVRELFTANAFRIVDEKEKNYSKKAVDGTELTLSDIMITTGLN